LKILTQNEVKIVSVCGARDITSEIFERAEKLGNLLAKEGYVVACGGLSGTMEAVAKGALSAGGTTVGILPTYSKESANPYITIAIPTGLGESRNIILVSMADVVVSISGGAGTLSEIALAWKLGKPVVSLSTSGGWSAKLAGTRIDSTRAATIYSASTCEEVIDFVNSQLK